MKNNIDIKTPSRRVSKQIQIGGVKIGGGAPIVVQSMANTDTRDVKSTIQQIKQLEQYGCEIISVAVPDMQAAEASKRLKKASKSRSLRIFISITVWRWRRWTRVSMVSASIRAISATAHKSNKLSSPPKNAPFPSVSA